MKVSIIWYCIVSKLFSNVGVTTSRDKNYLRNNDSYYVMAENTSLKRKIKPT